MITNQPLQPVKNFSALEANEPFNSPLSPSQPSPDEILSEPIYSAPPKRLNKALLVGGLVMVGLLIVGGGVFAYFNYFPSPTKIIQKMFAKLAETKFKTLEYSGEIKIAADASNLLSSGFPQPTQPATDKKVSNLLIDFTGSSDIQNLDDTKNLFALTIKTDALSSAESVFGLEARVIGKAAYVKFNSLPNLGFFDLSAVKNQWVKIDGSALKIPTGLEKIEQPVSEASKKSGLTQEQNEKISIILGQAKIIKTIEKLPSEKIEGVNAYHYKIIFDQEAVKKVAPEIGQIIQNRILTEIELAEFNKYFATVELPAVEIWIGKTDLLPRKIFLSATIKASDKLKASGQISFALVFKSFNQPVKIEVPAPVKTLEEILSGLFGGSFGISSSTALPSASQPEAIKDTDNDGLTDQQEIIYGTDLNNPDTDGDGFKDGDEVKNGYNPKGAGKLTTKPLDNMGLDIIIPTERAKARSAIRISNIKMIQTALELYFNDYNRYPGSLSDLVNLSSSRDSYLNAIPKNPVPNDGSCDTNFEYKYNVIENGASYELDYCLGEASGNLKAGYHKATPTGL